MSEDYARDWRDDTISGFPAVTGDTEVIPAATDECRCGMCPASAEPGKDALLSCGPGVVTRMWRTRVANGQWADIAAEADAAHARVHLPALRTNRRIRADLAARRYDIAAMLSRNTALLSDQVLGNGLRDMAGRLAGPLADMQAETGPEVAA